MDMKHIPQSHIDNFGTVFHNDRIGQILMPSTIQPCIIDRTIHKVILIPDFLRIVPGQCYVLDSIRVYISILPCDVEF